MSLEKAQHTPNAHTSTGQSPDMTVVNRSFLRADRLRIGA
jgi:hypothetical protein